MNITFEGTNVYGNLVFRAGINIPFNVLTLNNGIIKIQPIGHSSSFEEFAKVVVSFFEPCSYFYGIHCVEFYFSGVFFHVSDDNADVEKLIERFEHEKQKSQPCDPYFF